MFWKYAGKVIALGSSLLLGCGYIKYRQQEQATQAVGTKAVLPGSKNPNQGTLLPSSKHIDSVLFQPKTSPEKGDTKPINRNNIDEILDSRTTLPPLNEPPR